MPEIEIPERVIEAATAAQIDHEQLLESPDNPSTWEEFKRRPDIMSPELLDQAREAMSIALQAALKEWGALEERCYFSEKMSSRIVEGPEPNHRRLSTPWEPIP